MTAISLTTFVDFSAATGAARLTSVRKAKAQYAEDYEPAHDFYKGLREAIVERFESGWDAKALRQALNTASSKKAENYEERLTRSSSTSSEIRSRSIGPTSRVI